MLNLPPAVAERDAELVAAIDALVARHGHDRGALLPILQDLHADHGEVGDLAMQVVADRLGAAPSEVQGVVSFYAFLAGGARGRHVVRLCRTLSCAMAGTRAVGAALERELGIGFGDTTGDGAVTLEWTNCIGLCDTPPAVLVDAVATGGLTPERVVEVVAALLATGDGSGDDVGSGCSGGDVAG